MSNLSPEAAILVADWFRRARENQYIHYECGSMFSRRHYFLGIPAIVLSAAVGTAVFASLETEASGTARIIIGLISICAAVLASLQTFLGYSNRAERHRITGARYGALRRLLEHLTTFPPSDNEELKSRLDAVRVAMDTLAEEAPEVPSSLKKRLDGEIKAREHQRIFHVPGKSKVLS